MQQSYIKKFICNIIAYKFSFTNKNDTFGASKIIYMRKIIWLAVGIACTLQLKAQDTLTNKKDGGYHFKIIKKLESTDVKDQCKSGTCWSFSSVSFFESELIRMGKGKHDLSEMFIVHHAYNDKAEKYIRMYGNYNFGPGGAFHDIPYVIKKYGIVPEEAFRGLNYGEDKHQHSEFDAILKAMADVAVKKPAGKLSPAWKEAYKGTLDAYLGKIPSEFNYQNKKYTPQSFAQYLGLNMDDYVSITSFTHHPFYEEFAIEVPDNWVMANSYNLPLDEMMQVMEHAITNGYTLAWAADVSEKGFAFKQGLAIVPKDESTIDIKGKDNAHFNDAGADKKSSAFDVPVEEKEITQALRQEAFDNLTTTDDHGMHATGIVKDQNGKKYYMIKNSWGEANDNKGYFFASEAYVRYKTINIYLHKNALPADIKKKLGIK